MGARGAHSLFEAASNQPITVKEKHQLVRIFPRREEGRMRRRGGQVHMKAAEINTVLHRCVRTSSERAAGSVVQFGKMRIN